MPHLESRTELIEVRDLRYCVRHWGAEDAPRLFLLHGWMDSSPTFQFVVEAFRQSWHVIAPDWRGYGASDRLSRPYWFPDYYADLHCLLERYSPDEPARLVGHSMGANIVATYAAVRPGRVRQLAMLDFLGLKPAKDVDAPTQLGKWLDGVQGHPKMSTYPGHEALARRLMGANPRLTADKAAFLARTVSRTLSDGQVEMACDPWHKIPSPAIFQIQDAMASWRKIAAPVLMLVSEQGFVQQRFGNEPDEYQRRIGCFADVRVVTVADAGHNLQHDQPEQVAAALEGFLTR
ncbi:MAG: alpha/beta hydrolase [Rhodocyclaceae bacterium]|nr:alpha/beta hydrolase [Rhodocyclaceae bacterium]